MQPEHPRQPQYIPQPLSLSQTEPEANLPEPAAGRAEPDTGRAEWYRPPVPEQKPHRFGARTILVPLLFILLHLVAATLVSALYVVVLVLINSAANNQDMLATLSDAEALNRLLTQHYPIITVLYSLVLVPTYALYLVYARRRDPLVLHTDPLRPSDLFAGLAMMVGALGLTNLYFVLLDRLSDSIPLVDRYLTDYERISESFTPDAGMFWLILGISVMAPLTEELLFRGIVQGELRRVMPEPAAIVLQAVVFAAYHMQPVQSTYALIPGLLLGIAYAWSRSIWVPILMHMTFNLLGSLVPLLNGEDAGLGQITALAQLAFIVVGVLAGIYMHMNRRRAPAASEHDRSTEV